MKRRRIKKVRTTICIDEDIFLESGDYIYNLSAFVQECMRREIEKQKNKKVRIMSIMSNDEKTSPTDIIDDVELASLLESLYM